MTDKDKDSDNVIKNPARQEKKEYVKYIPNYIKLNTPAKEINFSENKEIEDNSFIDNNDVVDLDIINPVNEKLNKETDSNVLVGHYILMVQGSIIYTGDINEIQPIISSILYNEHPDFNNINVEEIVLLKRVNIKCGVFVDE